MVYLPTWMVEFTYMLFTYIYLYVGMALSFGFDTVDGRNPANQLRLAVYPIINTVFYIPGRAGFLPSTVGSTYWGCNPSYPVTRRFYTRSNHRTSETYPKMAWLWSFVGGIGFKDDDDSEYLRVRFANYQATILVTWCFQRSWNVTEGRWVFGSNPTWCALFAGWKAAFFASTTDNQTTWSQHDDIYRFVESS